MTTTSGRRVPTVGLIVVVAFFAAVRLAACLNDLWLDEIWSLTNALGLTGPLETLTLLHIDNNHPLYTLWLYALGDDQPVLAYRFLAWLAGVATLVVAGLTAAREQRRPEVASGAFSFAILVFGGSYLLLHYSSEARGYSAAVAFALLAYYAVLRGIDEHRSRWAAVYWFAAALALLAHATAVHAIVGAIAWTTARWLGNRSSWTELLGRLIWWHAVPVALAAGYWWIFLRHLAIGGGPLRSLADQAAAACAYALGLPTSFAYVALLIAAAALAGALFVLKQSGSDRWIFYSVTVLGSPAAMLAVTRHEVIFERYFLVNLAFLLLPVSGMLASGWNHGGLRKRLVTALVALFLVGNAIHAARLLRLGRGGYRAALSYIAENSLASPPGSPVTLGSDHDFRNGTLINYHSGHLSSGTPLRYLVAEDWPAGGPQWLVLHRQVESTLPSAALTDTNGNLYMLERTYSYAAMSGWNWFLLRNQNGQSGQDNRDKAEAAVP